MELKEFLKRSRVRAGLSQRDVANHLKYKTPQFISNWERGLSGPPISEIKKLSGLYKINSDDLYQVMLNSAIESLKDDFAKRYKRSK